MPYTRSLTNLKGLYFLILRKPMGERFIKKLNRPGQQLAYNTRPTGEGFIRLLPGRFMRYNNRGNHSDDQTKQSNETM